MDANDLVYKVAERARVLANKPINELRYAVGGEDAASTYHAAVAQAKHLNRGQLIEHILTEEFCVESPEEIGGQDASPTN